MPTDRQEALIGVRRKEFHIKCDERLMLALHMLASYLGVPCWMPTERLSERGVADIVSRDLRRDKGMVPPAG